MVILLGLNNRHTFSIGQNVASIASLRCFRISNSSVRDHARVPQGIKGDWCEKSPTRGWLLVLIVNPQYDETYHSGFLENFRIKYCNGAWHIKEVYTKYRVHLHCLSLIFTVNIVRLPVVHMLPKEVPRGKRKQLSISTPYSLLCITISRWLKRGCHSLLR